MPGRSSFRSPMFPFPDWVYGGGTGKFKKLGEEGRIVPAGEAGVKVRGIARSTTDRRPAGIVSQPCVGPMFMTADRSALSYRNSRKDGITFGSNRNGKRPEAADSTGFGRAAENRDGVVVPRRRIGASAPREDARKPLL